MSRVGLLGGAGFIGSFIARELVSRGHTVRILVRPSTDLSLINDLAAEIVQGDMENISDLLRLLEGCDSLIHAAAYYPVYSLGKARQVELATQQIHQIHDALKQAGTSRFVYVSSLSAVGEYPDGKPEDEHAPYPAKRLRGTYNSVKRAMQELVLANARRFNTVVVAPTGVFGPGDRKPTSGRLLVDLAKGHLPVILKAKTNVVDVRTVAMGTANALEKGRTGRLYLLGGENTTLTEFIKQAAQIAGVRPPVAALPPGLLLPVARLSEWVGRWTGQQKPLLPIVGVEFALYGTHLSSEVAVQEIGYQPDMVPTEQMLSESYEWFREKGYL